MHFQVTIECSASALGGDTISRSQELANILIAVAADLLDQGLAPRDRLPLRDHNGHSVGIAQLTEQPLIRVSNAPVKQDAGGGAERLRQTGGQARPLRRELSVAGRAQRD
ncbi:hypothetical protein [Methylocystis hirsuta]|uniref:Uncharacterized protein n=1 Tax=Methylocystis hirsuta TaxID=369798 RepID=A0A3M9XT16_9HYPH|nr:hypothetical protein [Methylocystis hirsuta]RNJ51403.1 hypothetical protein D1O30_19185 [Methylocystis hirsuta]